MMTNPALDPNDEVLAPLDRTLDSLVTRGMAAFAVGLLALVVTVAETDGLVHDVSHLALPALLAWAVVRRLRSHVDADLEVEGAWARARAARRWETGLAAAITGSVPVMWLVGGASVVYRHANDVPSLAIIIGVVIPLGAFLWGAAAYSFVMDARDRVALGLRDSDRRFRIYWQNIGRVA
jgi:threonine/homoserine/homoserine lactone efflux protein